MHSDYFCEVSYLIIKSVFYWVLGPPGRHQLILHLWVKTVTKWRNDYISHSLCWTQGHYGLIITKQQYLFTVMHLSIPAEGQTRAWLLQRTSRQISACPLPHNYHDHRGVVSRYSRFYAHIRRVCWWCLRARYSIRPSNLLVLISHWAVLCALLSMHITAQAF